MGRVHRYTPPFGRAQRNAWGEATGTPLLLGVPSEMHGESPPVRPSFWACPAQRMGRVHRYAPPFGRAQRNAWGESTGTPLLLGAPSAMRGESPPVRPSFWARPAQCMGRVHRYAPPFGRAQRNAWGESTGTPLLLGVPSAMHGESPPVRPSFWACPAQCMGRVHRHAPPFGR